MKQTVEVFNWSEMPKRLRRQFIDFFDDAVLNDSYIPWNPTDELVKEKNSLLFKEVNNWLITEKITLPTDYVLINVSW